MSKSIAIVTSIHPDFDKRVWRHARGLAELGCEVHLVCPWDMAEGQIVCGVTFHPFKRGHGLTSRVLIIPIKVCSRLYAIRHRIEIIHFHDIDLLPWMSLWTLFKDVVYDVHENYPAEVLNRKWLNPPLRRLLSWFVRHAQKGFSRIVHNVVLVTPYQEPDFSGAKLNKVFVRNYASVHLLKDERPDYLLRGSSVIFTGMHNINNGSMLLLDIAEMTLKKRPGVVFIAPDRFTNGSFRAAFIEAMQRKLPAESFRILPPVRAHEIMLLLNQATIGINPNLRVEQQIKGVHTKLFEFMAASLPIVTSDLPHQKALVEETGAGLLAKPEQVESFVDSITYLVDNTQEAYAMGLKGRAAFIEKYSWENEMRTLINFYESINSGKK